MKQATLTDLMAVETAQEILTVFKLAFNEETNGSETEKNRLVKHFEEKYVGIRSVCDLKVAVANVFGATVKQTQQIRKQASKEIVR